MENIFLVLICALIGGVLSLVGGILLVAKDSKKMVEAALGFAAGALIAAAFMELLPEALETGETHQVMFATMVGVVLFFVLEFVIKNFTKSKKIKPINLMVLLGDTLHNFVDGAAIAAGFLVSPVSGAVVTLAIVLHEVPQEIGDFAVMYKNGMSKKQIIVMNLWSSLAAVVSAVGFYLAGNAAKLNFSILLGAVAGFFIYTAVAGIIPVIHSCGKEKKTNLNQAIWLIVGIVLVGAVMSWAHNLAHEMGGHSHTHTHTHEEHRD